MDSEPSVYLIQEEVSYGDPSLDTLKLLFKNGKPTLFWQVSWRGAFNHADGTGGLVEIPPDMLPSLTAKSLTDWMLHRLGESVTSLANFPAFARDHRVIAWCEAVRKIYASPSSLA